MKNIILITLLTFILLASCDEGNSNSTPAGKGTDKKEKIIIASKDYLSIHGMNVHLYNMFYDEDNAWWKANGLKIKKLCPGEAEKITLLTGREYQVVIFSPKKNAVVFHLICFIVFVDKNCREVITTFRVTDMNMMDPNNLDV